MESRRRATISKGVTKRTRQACSACRRRKTKCSGERPVCTHCQQSRLSCIYEPYTITMAAEADHHGTDLLHRISSIETILNKLTQDRQDCCNQASNPPQIHGQWTPPPRSPVREDGPLWLDAHPSNNLLSCRAVSLTESERASEPDHLPPAGVVSSLVNTYFSRVHNQPYAFFHPGSFLQRLRYGTLQKCLLYAVLSMAVRFTDHPHYQGDIQEASDVYSRRSWLHVIEDYLAIDDNLDLAVIQTVALLALADYTAGRASSGWLRLGLAVRLSQDFELMQEPPFFLLPTEIEERRRTFWSVYIVDKLMSCSRSRPPAIMDEDCTLQLPCDEDTFLKGEWVQTPTLDQIQRWQSAQTASVSVFGLTVVAASTFGRCVKYVYGRCGPDVVPPWDPTSDYIATNALLLLIESLMGQTSLPDIVIQEPPEARQASPDVSNVGHEVFPRVLFHLSHCLLNHPFVMRLRLRPIAARTPVSFIAHAFQLSQKHARHLTDLITAASGELAHLESSPYSYCAAVAAGIHSLAHAMERQGAHINSGYDAASYYTKTLQGLERLAGPWPFAARMKTKLEELESRQDEFASFFDYKGFADELRPESEQFLWSLLDLGSLTKEGTGTTPASLSFLADLPSPANWALSADQNTIVSSRPGCDMMTELDSTDIHDLRLP